MLDRDKIIKAVDEAFNMYRSEYEGTSYFDEKEWAENKRDAIFLLKKQEGIVPYIDIDEAKCPVCKVKLTRQELIGDDVLFEDFFDYCPHCGKPVLWEGRRVE